jgi:hypothetical protein
MQLDSSTPASPPEVRYRLEKSRGITKLDSIRSGFAAGCEAGLCPAVLIY